MKEEVNKPIISNKLVTNEFKNHLQKIRSEIDPKGHSDDSLDWDIELSDSEGVKDEEGKLLTSLVRRTYIRHVHRSLLQNYESWFKNYGDGIELSESVISRSAAQLEKKALKACMLASLYQHSVVRLIKNIKKSTDQNKLYEDLFSSLNTCKKRCEKGIQTDDISVTGLKIGNFLSPIRRTTFSPMNALPVRPTSGNTSCQSTSSTDISNLDNTSAFLPHSVLPSPQPVPSPFAVPNNTVASKFILSYLPKNEACPEIKCPRLSNMSESSLDSSSIKIYNPECDPLSEKRHVQSKEGKSGSKRKILPQVASLKKRKSSLETANQQNLEERLKKFEEIFGDPCEDVPPDPKPPDKSVKGNYTKFFSLVSWKLESIAQMCELNKKLLRLPPAHLQSLKVRFERLFGRNDPLTELTADDFTHCRKRLANIVVSQLTPYFDLGQIGSRIVFKALAREITRIILNDTFAADMQFSQNIVDDVFQNGVKYQTLDDVNILCSR